MTITQWIVRLAEIALSAAGSACAVAGFVVVASGFRQGGWLACEIVFVVLLFLGTFYVVAGQLRASSIKPTKRPED